MDLSSIPRIDQSRLGPVAVQLAGSAALVGMAYLVAPTLLPGALLLGIVFLLFPLRRKPFMMRMMLLAVVLTALWFFVTVSEFLTPFIIGALLVYITNPAVTRLERRGVPRWVSSLACVLLLAAGTTALIAYGAPRFVDRLDDVDRGLRAILGQLTVEVESGRALPGVESFGASQGEAGMAVTQAVSPELQAFGVALLWWVSDLVSSFARIAQQVIALVILPFFIFFLLRDLPRLWAWLVAALPTADGRDRFVAVVGRLDDMLGRYFRGAIIVAAIQGTISGTGLWIIGIEYPVLLGIITGFLDFFPYIGLFISLVISALVAYTGGGAFVTKIFLITILYLAQKLLEATVLGPKIIGPHVGLHPVLLIMSLVVFEYFLGFIGLLIAVPVGAIIMASGKAWSAAQSPRIIIQSAT